MGVADMLLGAGVTLGAITACATALKAPDPIVPAGHHFDYAIENRESVQLIQVFDDGSRTYLQFRQPPADPVTIDDESSKTPLGYLNDGPYLVVAGIYHRLEVTVGDRSTEVREEADTARPDPPDVARLDAAYGSAQR